MNRIAKKITSAFTVRISAFGVNILQIGAVSQQEVLPNTANCDMLQLYYPISGIGKAKYMNRKIPLIITAVAISLFIITFFCSCSENANGLSRKTAREESTVSFAMDGKLPPDFSVDKVKSALLEYINYRLWLYPAKITGDTGDKSLDNYIGESIDVEIRVYNSDSGKTVYAYTSAGEWLAVFKNRNGFVYCDGQVSKDEKEWPQGNNYEVVEKYSVTIPKPHKPDYGTSQSKAGILDAIEATVKAACEDFYKGADKYYTEWENVDVYIADFYEHETGAHAWLCKQDGSITNFPVNFTQKNNKLEIYHNKGFTIKSKNEFNEFGRFQFERDIAGAVKHLMCNVVKEE